MLNKLHKRNYVTHNHFCALCVPCVTYMVFMIMPISQWKVYDVQKDKKKIKLIVTSINDPWEIFRPMKRKESDILYIMKMKLCICNFSLFQGHSTKCRKNDIGQKEKKRKKREKEGKCKEKKKKTVVIKWLLVTFSWTHRWAPSSATIPEASSLTKGKQIQWAIWRHYADKGNLEHTKIGYGYKTHPLRAQGSQRKRRKRMED